MRANLAVIAALLLSACAHKPEVVPVAVHVSPERKLLEDCPVEYVPIKTNADLVRSREAYKLALKLCNEDKRALREWDQRLTEAEARLK